MPVEDSPPVIAIDGPSASGKGTIARAVARSLGFHYLESGALYRLVALLSLRNGILSSDEPRLSRIAEELGALFQDGRIFLDDQDVTELIHDQACGNRASEIAPLGAVRAALLRRQHAFRRLPGLVADGRDMGTVVFPDAVLKVFLTASIEERARRRHKQLIDKGIHATFAALSRDLAERDARDAARTLAPLAPASDAVQLDSSELGVDEVVARVLGWYRDRN